MTTVCPLDVQSAEQPEVASAIELRQLSKTFPGAQVPALDGVDLAILPGQIFGLLGPNGAGKTTLMSILTGLLKPSSGSACILGRNVLSERTDIKRTLGMVPQEPAIYPTLTARENLEYFGRMQGLTGERLQARVAACLELAALEEGADQRVEHFSGGFKRRLNLVIGLVHEPQVLILDEPTVAIDPHSRALIHQRLRELHDAGISILLSTHDMEEAEQLCQGVAIMNRGKILAQDGVGALLQAQQNKCIQMQLEHEPPPGLADSLTALPGLREVSVEGRCVLVWADQPNLVLAPLTWVMQDQGAKLHSLSFGRASLEQLFLSLTAEKGG